MINTHRRQVAQIKQRVKGGGAPISRAEYRFMRTNRQDVLKCVLDLNFHTRINSLTNLHRLVPFVPIVVIAEELIPLIAMYAPGMLPSTTKLPSQLKKIEENAMEEQAVFAARKVEFTRIVHAGMQSGDECMVVDLAQLRALGGDVMKAVCGVLRLATWGPAPLLLWRIDQHLTHIARDDELLTKEIPGNQLGDSEVVKALYERGM